jgi:hypothetical protein
MNQARPTDKDQAGQKVFLTGVSCKLAGIVL